MTPSGYNAPKKAGDDCVTIGEKIQEVMDWSGKNQTELAALSDVSQSAISDYIRNDRAPSIDALQKIAAALDVSPWIFLNGEPLPVKGMDLTEAEEAHMREYRMLTESQRKVTDDVIRAFNHGKG